MLRFSQLSIGLDDGLMPNTRQTDGDEVPRRDMSSLGQNDLNRSGEFEMILK